ncbi:MAG: hypothetical protein IKH64_01785 [Prevotella sp.]|nr:hypothetical protein [Prevotella sp.]
MNRTVFLSIIALILLFIFVAFVGGVGLGPLLFLLLVLVILLYKFVFKKESSGEVAEVMNYTLETVIRDYGNPDDTVVLDASRANELSSLILFYHAKDLALVEGHEVKISEITGVAPKNFASPYTVDEWGVVINTTNKQYPTFRLRVGYDGGLASEIAKQIYGNIA